MQVTNEWVNWVEEAVDKEYFKFYEYNQFNNIQHIGTGGFGKVFRANWKNSEKQFALKSFFSLDKITVKEIVRELKIQREVDFHDNIIHCHGITKFESDNHNNYWLVMEYADGALDISQGHRETAVPDTPDEYVKIYTKCWDGEPDNRPTIYQVVELLNARISKTDVIVEDHQMSNEIEFSETSLSTNNPELQGDLSQLIQNFDKINIKEIDPMLMK
ncbi:unnamed protein product [Rhizophagus irregularis]|nr:unnamed protein product [Rhizophagus irregularis]